LSAHLDLLLGEQRRAGWRCEQVFVLVDAAGADQFPKGTARRILAHILDVNLRGARLAGAFAAEAGEFIGALSDVTARRRTTSQAVISLKPGNG